MNGQWRNFPLKDFKNKWSRRERYKLHNLWNFFRLFWMVWEVLMTCPNHPKPKQKIHNNNNTLNHLHIAKPKIVTLKNFEIDQLMSFMMLYMINIYVIFLCSIHSHTHTHTNTQPINFKIVLSVLRAFYCILLPFTYGGVGKNIWWQNGRPDSHNFYRLWHDGYMMVVFC